MRITLAAAVLGIGVAGPLAAQAQTEEKPPPAAESPPAAAAPSPAPAPQEVDPAVEKQRKSAAKLAGMIRFVAVSCPDVQPDYDRFKTVIAAMRIDIKELESGPLLGESLGYSRAYDKDKDASCKRAVEYFGENGTTVPGLLGPKKAQ